MKAYTCIGITSGGKLVGGSEIKQEICHVNTS